MTLNDLPAIGQPLESGLFAGLTTRTDGTHCAVVLLADKPETRLTWQQATDWAEGLQAELPTRPVAALLFAQLKDQFEAGWHWTSETDDDDGSFAWLQGFSYGNQFDYLQCFEGRARAVRMIPLSV